MRRRWACALALALTLGALACASPRGVTLDEKRQAVRAMRDAALHDLLLANPAANQRLREAEGYAVFSKLSLAFVVGTGGGYGLARDNRSGEEFFMRSAEGSLGFGAGVKTLRLFFVFHERTAFERFLEEGVSVGVASEVAAVVDGETGVAASARGASAGGASGVSASARAGGDARATSAREAVVEIYQFTETGLVLQVGLTGARYWLDEKLN